LNQVVKVFSGIPKPVWWLSLVSFINRCGAMVISFLTLYLTDNLHFTLIEAGYLMSIFGLGDIAGAFLGGKWTDKYGYQRVQLWTLVGSGVFFLVLMLLQSFWAIAFALFTLNLIGTAFRPANSVAIRLNSSDENRTRSFSLLRVAVNLAITFALAVGGYLILLGWHWIFIADSITCFAAAAFVYFYIPEKKIVQKQIEIEIKKAGKQNSQSPYKDKDFLLFTFLTFLGAMVFMQLLWSIPPFFKKIYGWNEAQIGLIAAVNGLVVTLVEMPMIYKIEGKRSNMWFVRLGIFFYGASYLILTLPVSYAIFSALFYMTVISFGEIFVMPFSTTWATRRAPEATQGQYMALYTMAYSVANVFAPMMGTQVIDRFGFDTLWIILACISVVTFFGFATLGKRVE
jgi:predicted MFS family arabinose efflux permease